MSSIEDVKVGDIIGIGGVKLSKYKVIAIGETDNGKVLMISGAGGEEHLLGLLTTTKWVHHGFEIKKETADGDFFIGELIWGDKLRIGEEVVFDTSSFIHTVCSRDTDEGTFTLLSAEGDVVTAKQGMRFRRVYRPVDDGNFRVGDRVHVSKSCLPTDCMRHEFLFVMDITPDGFLRVGYPDNKDGVYGNDFEIEPHKVSKSFPYDKIPFGTRVWDKINGKVGHIFSSYCNKERNYQVWCPDTESVRNCNASDLIQIK